MIKTGKLNFHSETGTEGGYYTLQDAEYITYKKPDFGVFASESVYDPQDVFRRGKVHKSYREDGTDFNSGKPGDVSYLDIIWDDNATDVARVSSTVFVERWSYNGLMYIENGDRLSIFERGVGSVALWGGTVMFKEQDPYDKFSFAPFGMACHQDPLTTDPVSKDEWSAWFFESRWANLEH